MSTDRHHQSAETADDLDTLIDRTLDEMQFDDATSHLTARQATVLVLREHGIEQASIADHLGCSRANVSSIESSARKNIDRSRQTIRFVELLSAPVRIELPTGLDLYEVPDIIYSTCDEHDVKVSHGAPELIRLVRDTGGEAVLDGTIVDDLVIHVASDGSVRVLHQE